MLKCRVGFYTVIWLMAAGAYLGSTENPSRSPEAEQLVFQATNKFRLENKLPALIWDQRLSDIAYDHSVDMIVRNFFDHVNPDGRNPMERIHRRHRQFIGNAGENLSVLVASPPLAPSLISDKAIGSWLDSPPHRANLLDPAFTHVGIGIAIAGVEAKTTQDFMQVRGMLEQPLPELLAHGEKLELKVVPFPEDSAKAEKYILEPLLPGSESAERVPWDLSVRHPKASPGRYRLQFCFPAPPSRFLEVFPVPEIEIAK